MPAVRINIQRLREQQGLRPPGYLEECLARGRLAGDWVEFDRLSWSVLCWRYRLWGDRVAMLAKPVARVIDRLLGSNLAQCSGCNSRRLKLNAMSFQRR